MLLLVATASLLSRQAYRSLQYSLYYAFPHFLLMPPPVRDGTEWLPVRLLYFFAVWRSMSTNLVSVAQSTTAMLVLVFLTRNLHPEMGISDFPGIRMVLQNSISTELLLWRHCILGCWVLSSPRLQLWAMRWAARLERLDHILWKSKCFIFEILYIGVFHCSWTVASWFSLGCFKLGSQRLICLVTFYAACRLLLQWIAAELGWWVDAGLAAASVPTSRILSRWWLRATLYLIDEAFILQDGNGYEYQTLRGPNQIRLLVIYPWTLGTVVRCKLVEVSLDDYPIYETLSYTWGSNKETERILVNGRYQDIPANAYKALTELSSNFLPRVIWIDSVCINQSDRMERSKQVLLMERIYSQAFEVTVWLGSYHFLEQGGEGLFGAFLDRYVRTDLDDDTLLLSDAHLAVNLIRDFLFAKQLDEDALRRESLSMLMGASEGLEVYSWRALRRFLHHPWFERIWVVQEVCLAKNLRVLYGGEEIEWRTVAIGLGRIFHELQVEAAVLAAAPEQPTGTLSIPPALLNVLGMEKMRQQVQDNDKLTFSDALKACAFFKATDPRDRIFGVRSMCSSLPGHLMDPDYTVPSDAVYINAAESLIIEKNFDHVFGFAGVGMVESSNVGITGLPSWVPDWTAPPKCIPYAFTSNEYYYEAGRAFSPQIEFRAGSRLLLSGLLLDTVTEVGPLFEPRTTRDASKLSLLRNLIHKYEESWRLVEQSPQTLEPYPFTSPTQFLREVFWRSLVGDRSKNLYPAPPELGDMFENLLKDMRQFLDSHDVTAELPLEDQQSRDPFQQLPRFFQSVEFEEMRKRGVMGRRMCITHQGYVGVCPPYSLAGDIVCVVPGLRTPLLLRRVPESKKKLSCYKYVGECYVHGIMQGETLADISVLQRLLII